MPLAVLNSMLFSKLTVKAEDIISALKVQYDVSWGPLAKESQEKILTVEEFRDEKSVSGALPELLRRREKLDPDFARKFLFFASGYWYVPVEGFRILIEFNRSESVSADSLPVSRTCVCTLVLPGLAYEGDPDILEEKLDLSMSYADHVGFDMM